MEIFIAVFVAIAVLVFINGGRSSSRGTRRKLPPKVRPVRRTANTRAAPAKFGDDIGHPPRVTPPDPNAQKSHAREVQENQTRLTHRRLLDRGVLKGRAYVIDGDTIAIGRIKLRLDSIDAPELDQPYGRKAKWAMVDICRGHEITARLTGDVSYDRLLADCTLPDGTNIGEELIRRGLAIDYDHFSNGRFRHLEIREEHRHIRMARARRR